MSPGTLIWFALVIPAVTAIILKWKYSHETVWWEFLLPLAVAVVMIFAVKGASEMMATNDSEWWGNYITRVEYHEDWNEYVHDTCYETTCTGSGEDETCTTTSYDCSYVDFHPARLVLHDNSNEGETHLQSVPYRDCEERVRKFFKGWITVTNPAPCGSPRFDELRNRWDNMEFVDMNRDAHDNDGDMYVTTWDGFDDSLEAVFTRHSYENRVQASKSILIGGAEAEREIERPEVTEEDVLHYQLVDYPDYKVSFGNNTPVILGSAGHLERPAVTEYLNLWNAKLGVSKELRMLVVLFHEQPKEAALMQEAYWKGGNKNEFVVCIGLNKRGQLRWGHVISWTEEDQTLKSDIADWLNMREGSKLEFMEFAEYMVPELQHRFERKSFSDFDGLVIDPSTAALVMTFLLTLLSNIGLSFWLVQNEFRKRRYS